MKGIKDTEELELNNQQKMVVLFVVGLLVGSVITYIIFYKDKTTPDEVVDYWESSLMAITEVRPGLINRQSSVGQLQDFYFRYKPISTYLLKTELNDICGGSWNVSAIPQNPDFAEKAELFCEEVCNNG